MSDLSNDASIRPDHRGIRSISIHVLGTRCRIQFRCADPAASMRFMAAAASWLGAFDRKFSRMEPDSLLSRINAAGRNWTEIDPEMEQLLQIADNAHSLTEGLLDPADLPLTKLWEKAKAQNCLPEEAEIQQALHLSDWKKVRREPGKILLSRPGMGLDLQFIGRKYAVDMIVNLARKHGIQDALVQAGGDLYALGTDGEHPFWEVGTEQGIQTPDDTQLALSNNAVSCAHAPVMDRRTGRPVAHDLQAVTVVAPNCLTASIHAAGMLVLGHGEGLRLAESTGMVEACLLSEAGATVSTRGFSRHLVHREEPVPVTRPAPVPLAEPKVVQKWLARDLIRLWPWLLPVVLLLISFGPAGLQHGKAEPGAALAALGMVCMTFLITRRLWGHYRAHVAATMLMFTLGVFAAGLLPMPDLTLCLLNLAAIAALVHQRALGFFALLILGLLIKGPVAPLVPAGAALGWWIAGGRAPKGLWLPGTGITLAASLAVFISRGMPRLENAGTGTSWWQFLPLLFLALLPWSFCAPRVLRQGWRRMLTGTLKARHGLLAGWLLPTLALAPDGLTAGALLTVPALVIAFCPPLADARRLWKIGSAALTLWMAGGLGLGLSHESGSAPSLTKACPPAQMLRETAPPLSVLTAMNRHRPVTQTSVQAPHR